MEGSQGQWLQGSFSWDAAALEARPTKAVATKKSAGAPVCQVEGCGLDLTSLRYFFRKQRICEHHARADVVTDSAGRQLRFCQQCTRLEPLANFNAARRSCKTSLAKRQARAHRGKAHSSPDTSPERRASGGAGSSDSDSEEPTGSLRGSSLRGSSRRSGGAAHSSKRSRSSQPAGGAASPGAGAGAASNGSSGAPALQQLDVRFLPPPQPQQPAVQQVPAVGGPEDMLWGSSLCDNDIEDLLALDPEALADVLLMPPPGGTTVSGSSGSGITSTGPVPSAGQALALSHQPVHNSMLPGNIMGNAMIPNVTPPVTAAYSAASPAVFPGHEAGTAASASATPWPGATAGPLAGMRVPPTSHPTYALGAASQPLSQLPGPAPERSQEWGSTPQAMQVAAMQQQASGVAAAVQHAHPLHVITRFSLKIFGVNPDHLPPQLRAELLAALQVSPTVLEGAIRCGCTHMVVDVLLSWEERQGLATPARVASAVQRLRRRDSWLARGAPPAIVAQLGPLVALGTACASAADAPLPCLHMGTAQLLPRLTLAGPVATTATAAHGTFLLAATPPATGGAQLPAGLAAALRCRCHGKHVSLAVTALNAGDHERDSDGEDEGGMPPPLAREEGGPAVPDGASLLEAWAPEARSEGGCGLYEFELSSGSLLSEAVPVLVLPDAAADAAAELCQLQQRNSGAQHPAASTPTIVRLVAAVLRFLQLRSEADAAGAGSAAEAAIKAAYPPAATAKLATVAQRLVAMAVRARWPAVARLLLPAVTADGASAASALRQLDALAAPAPSLLHLANASGSAAMLAALRGWAASQHASLQQEAAPEASGCAEAARITPLLVAAAMGSSLTPGMVQELTGLLGREGVAAAADEAADGWTPRQVAEATGNLALLAALPPRPRPSAPTQPPASTLVAAAQGAEAEQARLAQERTNKKLRALQEDWSYEEPLKPIPPPPEAPAKPQHSLVGKSVYGGQARPSRDAILLSGILREMDVPEEEATAACANSASGLTTSHQAGRPVLVPTSAAGVAAAVAAALASLAIRMAF